MMSAGASPLFLAAFAYRCAIFDFTRGKDALKTSDLKKGPVEPDTKGIGGRANEMKHSEISIHDREVQVMTLRIGPKS
jgi:hypothetical protein